MQAALDFTTLMGDCIPTAVEMLRSKVVTDVLESLEFLRVAKMFGIDGAEEAIAKSLPLVWSQDERLRNAVVSTYAQLYLISDTQCKPKAHSIRVVQNLLRITSNSTSGELASLEKLVGLFVSDGHVSNLAIKELWQIYCHNSPGMESVLACQLLSMAVSANVSDSSLSADLDRLLSSGLVQLMVNYYCSGG